MAPRWIGFVVFIFVLAALIGSVSEGVSLAGTGQQTTLNKLLSFSTVRSEQSGGYFLEFIGNIPGYFDAFFTVIFLDFPLFPPGTPWELVKWIFWAPPISVIVFGLVIIFFGIWSKVI